MRSVADRTGSELQFVALGKQHCGMTTAWQVATDDEIASQPLVLVPRAKKKKKANVVAVIRKQTWGNSGSRLQRWREAHRASS